MSKTNGTGAPQGAPDGGYLSKIAALADIVGNRKLTSVLVTLAGITLPLDDRRFLEGPVVYHQSAWADTMPPWMPQLVARERLEIVTAQRNMIVGPCEVACVMYGASFDRPLGSELSDIYLWACVEAVSRHRQKPKADIWAEIGGRAVEDRDVVERGGRLWHDYQSLAHEIRRKVIAAQTDRDREDARDEKAARARRDAGEPPPRGPRPERMPRTGKLPVQISLFE